MLPENRQPENQRPGTHEGTNHRNDGIGLFDEGTGLFDEHTGSSMRAQGAALAAPRRGDGTSRAEGRWRKSLYFGASVRRQPPFSSCSN